MKVTHKLAAIGAAAIALVGGAGLAWIKLAPRHTPAGQRKLALLDAAALASFRDDFNAGAGQTRIIALLSPT